MVVPISRATSTASAKLDFIGGKSGQRNATSADLVVFDPHSVLVKQALFRPVHPGLKVVEGGTLDYLRKGVKGEKNLLEEMKAAGAEFLKARGATP